MRPSHSCRRGVASAQDVDAVVKYGFGRRLAVAGPFEVWEQIGWDLVSTISSELFPEIDRSTEVPKVLRDKVEAGELGTKTGKGFYDWTPRVGRGAPPTDQPGPPEYAEAGVARLRPRDVRRSATYPSR